MPTRQSSALAEARIATLPGPRLLVQGVFRSEFVADGGFTGPGQLRHNVTASREIDEGQAIMPTTVFISYSHRQGDWVWDRLVPCLRAGGADVLIDREQFEAARALQRQMDDVQDRAELHVLVLSPEYLGSGYCTHEMDRAIRRDPQFEHGVVIPIIRVECDPPPAINGPNPLLNPLLVDLRDDRKAEPWKKLLDKCGDGLGTTAPAWLKARDDIRRHLERGESVNLTVEGNVRWWPLIEEIRAGDLADLGVVDLEDPDTYSRRGLVGAILNTCGVLAAVPDVPNDLAELKRVLKSRLVTRVALVHFHHVTHRIPIYGSDLFVALRYLVKDARTLILLIQSRIPFAALLPKDHPLSPINLKTVELKERP
jgi:hypothetical protein